MTDESRQRIARLRGGSLSKRGRGQVKTGGSWKMVTPEEVAKDVAAGTAKRLPGRQNRRHGTKWKRLRKIARASRRANR